MKISKFLLKPEQCFQEKTITKEGNQFLVLGKEQRSCFKKRKAGDISLERS
jgi:hypothetical protein